jgi:hypothetical protein
MWEEIMIEKKRAKQKRERSAVKKVDGLRNNVG